MNEKRARALLAKLDTLRDALGALEANSYYLEMIAAGPEDTRDERILSLLESKLGKLS